MAQLDFAGIFSQQDLSTWTYADILWFVQEYYVNQTPIIARLKRQSVNSNIFEVRHYKYRPRSYTIANAALNNTDTFTVLGIPDVTNRGDTTAVPAGFGDSSCLMRGDILSLGSERLEVIGVPGDDPGAQPTMSAWGYGGATPTGATVVVRRGAEGTTVATHSANGVMTLEGNSRTGGEINQNGIMAKPILQDQYVQDWEYPCQVAGGAEAMRAYGQQPGSPFETQKKQQLDNMMRDMERSSIYGIGEAYSPTNLRQKQIGMANQIVTNRVTSPTNASAYLPANFEQDVMEPLYLFGSKPNLIICASNFMRGFTTWSYHMERIEAGQTNFGVAIETYTSNFAPGCVIIPDPLMAPGTLYAGFEELLFWRDLESENFKPRGSRGDAIEGEWIARGAIEVRDEQKHVFLTGVTGFATP